MISFIMEWSLALSIILGLFALVCWFALVMYTSAGIYSIAFSKHIRLHGGLHHPYLGWCGITLS
ncbi:hypothetical protein [Vibrio sp. Hal054]|uniref:hypothetical protein n=1 Tax=Vibrio sp. Hal054 TaxID=3035158 RepID=UPI00301BBD36